MGEAIKVSFIIGLFIFLFLLVFQPFGLSTAPGSILLKTAVYGLITFLINSAFTVFIIKIFDESKWTILHQIIFYLVLLISIALANFYYTKTFDPLLGWNPSSFVLYTAAIGLFPIVFFIFFQQNRLFNRYKIESGEVNNALKKIKPAQGDFGEAFTSQTSKGTSLSIQQHNIVFIESVGNYLLIHHLSEDKIIQSKIRGTLKTIIKELNPILQITHRAFIVNSRYISSARGNAQGLKLTVKHAENEIPVSRSYVSLFRRYLEH